MLLQVQQHTLAASEEWTRMKNEHPNSADVRATKQLNAVIALMYSLPVTVVGLRLCMLSAGLTHTSTCFLVAVVCSWVALLAGW